MKKANKLKLVVNREVIRTIANVRLGRVVGGQTNDDKACPLPHALPIVTGTEPTFAG